MVDLTIQHKRSSQTGREPTTSDLEAGELAVNTYDGCIYLKTIQAGVEDIVKIANVESSNTISFADLENKPTTLAGYGIIDSFSGDYDDLTDKPDLTIYQLIENAFDGNYNSLANKPALFNGQFSSLDGTPTTIVGYGITDAFDGDYSSLANTPFVPVDITDLTDTTGAITHFSGNYNDLTNKPILVANLGDLGNVANTTPVLDNVLKWNGSTWAPGLDAGAANALELTDFSVTSLAASGAGTLTYDNTTGVYQYTPPDLSIFATSSSLSNVATSGAYSDLSGLPTIPSDLGDITDTGNLIPSALTDLSISDGTIDQVLSTNGSGTFTFTDLPTDRVWCYIGDNPPTVTNDDTATLWWESDSGRLKVYYFDGSSYQWVDASPPVGTGVESYTKFSTSTSPNFGASGVAAGSYLRNEADTADIEATATVTSGFNGVLITLNALVQNLTDTTTEAKVTVERSINSGAYSTIHSFIFPVANTTYGGQCFTLFDAHGASAGDTLSYKLKNDMANGYSSESLRVVHGASGDTFGLKEIK